MVVVPYHSDEPMGVEARGPAFNSRLRASDLP